ncbi:haloacid dehalogenase [Brevundimonas sp. Leaf280]|uniref:HAD family hydrolase n=1 Tax=Brevundimonas sp. Leaf280 TaxID=1736320 RepID=UPI0006F748F5|nr:HAD-IA family hydrolase [Brevundimonas sp. Leaf280]KQP46733.1 haloacid dehalogenase [Brevundimonas sp. Leaf280]
MTYDLIIFDYDGVVADSEVLNSTVMAEQLTAIGLPTSLDDVLAAYTGKRWRDNRPVVEVALGRACPDDFHTTWFATCRQRAPQQLEPVPGLLDFVAARPEPRCIASSSGPDWIGVGLDIFGLTDHFDGAVFTGLVVERGKPHPDIFLYAAHAMGVDPARVLVIEDSEAGVTAGVAAGMTVVGLTAGGHVRDGHAERLKARGAHHIADSYTAVSAFMDRQR